MRMTLGVMLVLQRAYKGATKRYNKRKINTMYVCDILCFHKSCIMMTSCHISQGFCGCEVGRPELHVPKP